VPLDRKGWLSLDQLFAGASEFLVTPLLMGLVCLFSQDRFEEPARLPLGLYSFCYELLRSATACFVGAFR